MRTINVIRENWRTAAAARDALSAERAEVRAQLAALEEEAARLRATIQAFEDATARGGATIELLNEAARARTRLAAIGPEVAYLEERDATLKGMQREHCEVVDSARLAFYHARKAELEAEIVRRVVGDKTIAALLVELHALPAVLGFGEPPRPSSDADQVVRRVAVPLRGLCAEIQKRAAALRAEFVKDGLG